MLINTFESETGSLDLIRRQNRDKRVYLVQGTGRIVIGLKWERFLTPTKERERGTGVKVSSVTSLRSLVILQPESHARKRKPCVKRGKNLIRASVKRRNPCSQCQTRENANSVLSAERNLNVSKVLQVKALVRLFSKKKATVYETVNNTSPLTWRYVAKTMHCYHFPEVDEAL